MEQKRVDPLAVHIDETCDVARGSYGEVRRATLDGHAAPVAVKELRPLGNAKQRIRMEIVGARIAVNRPRRSLVLFPQAFARELQVWADLEHPNILPLVGFHLNSEEGISWFISPFMTEGNIREYLERIKPHMLQRLQLASTHRLACRVCA